MRRQKTEGEVPRGRKQPPPRVPQRGYSSTIEQSHNNNNNNNEQLPTAWQISDPSLRHNDPVSITMDASPKTTVYANRPIVSSRLQQQSQSSNSSQVYYFEVTVLAPLPKATVEMAIGLFSTVGSFGAWPGEVSNSIGWGSEGLQVNGGRFDPNASSIIQFRNGDVIGCGIEVGGLQRVFFTLNGSIPVPPSINTSFPHGSCFPVVSFRDGKGHVLKANFGLDPSVPFRWEGHNIVQHSAMPHPSRFRSNPSFGSDSTARSRTSSPYYSISDLACLDDAMASNPLAAQADPVLSRSASRSSSGLVASPSTVGPPSYLRNQSSSRTYFGTKNNNRRSLMDEDSTETNAATEEHFKMDVPTSASGWPPASPSGSLQRMQSGSPYREDPNNFPEPRRMTSGSVRPTRREDRGQRRRDRPTLSEQSPSDNISVGSSHAPRPPPRREARSVTDSQSAAQNPGAVARAAGNEVELARANLQILLKAANKKGKDFDVEHVRGMLEVCKVDQERLQLKLNNAFEGSGGSENVEELLAINDGICNAIENGKDALKRIKEKKKKNRSVEGPTIDVLVQNQDVFSLICMLRAPSEKKMAAALALMQFARDDEMLRNEIQTNGGMHSFLSLFRTKGMTRELRVVCCLAVAYALPPFVASSQTSTSVGLKIVECLRFLAFSKPVTPQNCIILRDEMVKAASVGVNLLWINSIQPLIAMEKAKNESRKLGPGLQPTQTVRFARRRGQTAGAIFDQGQDSIEITDLMESAVALIAHIAKQADEDEVRIDMGYNIVEQVCEVDDVRPIVVREGLLRVLVDWIRSKDVDKVRPAASALRYLISIKDEYMAGWIHSQVVNEGSLEEIVKLLNESVGHDVRVAVSQMLSVLCVAPHTRAAVVEARCVTYLVALLYEHNAPAAEEMVHHACTALLQLAAGAVTRASASTRNYMSIIDSATHDKQERVINDIIEGWAHGSLVQIALEHEGKLRSVSVEALRVLSEDTKPTRQTRLQLCSAGAAEALGMTLNDEFGHIKSLSDPDLIMRTSDSQLNIAVKNVHEALRGLANMLEPQKESSKHSSRRSSQSSALNSKELLMKGCLDIVKSGGLDSLIWISSLPYSQTQQSGNSMTSVVRMDLLDEACRLLASLSPLLLSEVAAAKGCAKWASAVFKALDGILNRLTGSEDGTVSNFATEINIDALRGLGALARYEPMKIRIVDRSLPNILQLKNLGGETNELSNAASQVLLSLGFTDDEITVQVAGNNPNLLIDWFCLQRALLLQAMVRAELRAKIVDMWQSPFSKTDEQGSMALIGQLSMRSDMSSSSAESADPEEPIMKGLFENFTGDLDSSASRTALLKQYRNIYEDDEVVRSADTSRLSGNKETAYGLMSPHVFPLNDTTVEKDWVLAHQRVMANRLDSGSTFCSVGTMPKRIEKFLDCCFPSKLLRNEVVPINDLRPQSSYNFRALMMPQRRYFSFRREGQLLARLCEKQLANIDSDDVHCTLGFTNSTFAGEFVESLVQTLYLCPMIKGLSFARNADRLAMLDADDENDGDEGSGLLASLVGSLPAWVSYLTFDNVLNDRDLLALVEILETMGKLSAGNDFGTDSMSIGMTFPSVGQTQGKFGCISIRNSPQIVRESWISFFKMLGSSGPAKRGPTTMPLSCLKVLDLSGNKLGDEVSASVLELVHDKDSGCNLEQLDLSGNRIGRGTNIVKVLRVYTEYYRYNQKLGQTRDRKSWKSSLHTLALAENDLFLGQAALEIFALLKHNALCLRYLDLSNNGLEGDTYQLLASTILKNTALCHLDLSWNKFSSPLIDLILKSIDTVDAESGLSFFLFENNTPPLSDTQERKLALFLEKSRKTALTRFLKERERGLVELNEASADLELIGESQSSLFRNSSFRVQPPLQQADTADSISEEKDDGDNKITVLFSAPLVFADEEERLHPFAKLDFDMERELLWQCMKEASRDIEVSFDTAHHSRLLATLTKRCSCLHYSGHGHPNFLPFEDGMGGPNWLDVLDIKELIVRDGIAPFKFVFVSACYSGLAGETFASAGVPHVVCCRQESELKDTAALAFTRAFYLALAVGQTVKESFEQGCKAVRATPNLRDPEKEMEKFVLLPKDGNHDVPVFRAKPVREWPKRQESRKRRSLVRVRSMVALGAKSSELSVRNMMQEDPSPTAPQSFLGREVDMFYVLSALLKLRKRLVTVLGETGIGRSSLVCALCHYINERASTITEIQRIYFIKPKFGGRNVSCRSLLRQLLDKLQEVGKCQEVDEDADRESMLDALCKALKNDMALIVFDRTELLEKNDESEEFTMILSTLLYETKQVKILLTGRNSLGQPSIGGQVEHPFNLGPLNFANTVKLFANLSPHFHTPSERGSLFTSLVACCNEQAGLYPGDTQMSNKAKSILSILGDGVPAKIEKAAYSMSKEDLNRFTAEYF